MMSLFTVMLQLLFLSQGAFASEADLSPRHLTTSQCVTCIETSVNHWCTYEFGLTYSNIGQCCTPSSSDVQCSTPYRCSDEVNTIQNAQYLYCPQNNSVCGEQVLSMFDADFGFNFDNSEEDEYSVATQTGFSTENVCWYRLNLATNWKSEISITPEVLSRTTAEVYKSYSDGSIIFVATLTEGESEVLQIQQSSVLSLSSYYILVKADSDSSPKAKISMGVESDHGIPNYTALYALLGVGGCCALSCLGILGVYISVKVFNIKCKNRFNFCKKSKEEKYKEEKSVDIPIPDAADEVAKQENRA